MDKTPKGPIKLHVNSRRSDDSKLIKEIALCPIMSAIQSLYNNSTKLVSETKLGTSVKIVFNPEVLTTLRGLFPSTRSYMFQIHTSSTISSSGAGVVSVASPANPAVVTYSEWAALAALFDECRLVKSSLGLTSSAFAANKAIPLHIAFDHITSTAAGVGFGNVQRLAESVVINSLFMKGGSGRFRKKALIARTRLFATTTLPTSTTSDVGLNGQWDISGQDSTTNSVVVCYGDVENVVQFRNRA